MDQHIQNPQLRDVLERWLIGALPLLKLGPIGLMPRPWHDRIGMSVFIFDSEWGPAALPETQELLDAIMQAPEFVSRDGRPVDGHEREVEAAILTTKSVIGTFGLQYLQESTGDDFEPELFAVLYTDLETYLYRFDDIPIRMTIDLWNVEAEHAPISLSSGAVIRPLTEGEKAQLREDSRNRPEFFFARDAEKIPTPNLLIEFERNAGELTSREISKPYVVQIGAYSRAIDAGNRVVLALRLLNEGDIWLGVRRVFPGNRFLESVPALDLSRVGSRRWSSYDPFSPDQTADTGPPGYQLPADQIGRLSNVFAFLESDGQVRRELDVPLRRFELSHTRDRPLDGFIDLWIVLEGLFSPSGSESSYRMHQYIAQFVGQDARERWDIYTKAKESSRARNEILHGRRFPRSDELRDHTVSIQSFARRSLLKSIEENQKPNHTELEREIFLQGTPVSPE